MNEEIPGTDDDLSLLVGVYGILQILHGDLPVLDLDEMKPPFFLGYQIDLTGVGSGNYAGQGAVPALRGNLSALFSPSRPLAVVFI